MLTLVLASALALLAPLVLLTRAYCQRRTAASPAKSIAVVVLGDVGRSPRMMYHAQSLAQAGYKVLLVGFAGTDILDKLKTDKNVTFIHIAQTPPWISKLPKILFILVAPFKLVFGALSLLYTLVFAVPFYPKAILVQTPPALPTLPIMQLISRLQQSKLIIDWHNTGYSILGMRLGQSSPLTRLARKIEGYFGRRASAHIFVTGKMQTELDEMWKLDGTKTTFPDRPQEMQKRLNASEAHDLFSRMRTLRDPALRSLAAAYETFDTVFTTTQRSGIAWNAKRPALVVSSTSWTADEDFTVLLDALDAYDSEGDKEPWKTTKLIVLVTGKGPLKAAFEEQVKLRERKWKYVRCRTAWLESADYPKLLAAADLGISLHSSSSGLDFPMKIVDMLGASLRVLALDFACVNDGMQVGSDGNIFRSAEELAQQLKEELEGFPSRLPSPEESKRESQAALRTWQEEWSEKVSPIIAECCIVKQ